MASDADLHSAPGAPVCLAAPVFRPWRYADVESLVRYANNPKIALNLKDRFPYPYTAADGQYWIALNEAAHPTWQSFAIEVEGEAAGGVLVELGEDVFRRSADISYWVAERHWGRKIATAAAAFITDYAFATFDVVRLQALVFEWNPASRRVLEKVGYTLEGRMRQAVTKAERTGDVFMYARLRG